MTKLTDFGAFARVEGSVEGLIHISELASRMVSHPREVVREGDTVRLKVLRIEPERRRLGLSLQVERNVKETRRLRNIWAEGGIEQEVSSDVNIKLPASVGVGIVYTAGYKWMAALDMERAFWSRTANGRHATFELAGGILYRLGQAAPRSRGRRMEVGGSLGMALPFHNRVGKFQYVIEFGKRGDVGQHGVSERFMSQTLSFSGWVN